MAAWQQRDGEVVVAVADPRQIVLLQLRPISSLPFSWGKGEAEWGRTDCCDQRPYIDRLAALSAICLS